MKNAENIKRDWIRKIEKNNLNVEEYLSYDKVKCSCKKCGSIKIDNCRNLGYTKFKCKFCILSVDSLLIKEGKIELIKIDGTNIHLKCKNGHEYIQDRGNLLQGKGCKKCYNNNKAITKDIFLEKVKMIHGDMFIYNLKDYKNLHSKIEIKCEKNHSFIQKAANHLQGKACPICRESLGERIIANILKAENLIFKRQKTFESCLFKKKLKFDFYLPDSNSIIEFDGIQHYEPIKIFGGIKKFEVLKKCDEIKNKYCLNNNIKLLRINYKEDIKDKLSSFIKLIINNE